jgi:hypothetical protein
LRPPRSRKARSASQLCLCLRNKRKRLKQVRVKSASIDQKGNPVTNSMRRVCALSLPGVRMVAALFKNGPQHLAHYGNGHEKWPPSAQNAFLRLKPTVRVSESATKSLGIFAVTAPFRPRRGRSFLAPPSPREAEHAQNHFTRHARSINTPARNDQGYFVRDKRPKHLHERRNTVPEFVQIQGQRNLNFAGLHQRGEFRPDR